MEALKVKEKILNLEIKAQPNDVTCGPTCLHGVYNFFGEDIHLDEVINEVGQLSSGGTLAVMLGTHALKKGYEGTIYTYNLHIFDPSWFRKGIDISQKLREQMKAKSHNKKLMMASEAYLTFLSLGGKIKYQELTPTLLKSYLQQGIPILLGLSATYLYDSPREIGDDEVIYDDINGEPTGHFVIVIGYNSATRHVFIADPLKSNPFDENQYYEVSFKKLIAAIMLGVVTYDANLLMLNPKKTK